MNGVPVSDCSYVVPDALATSADYATWTGTTSPTLIDQTLRACTALVLDATKRAWYATDPLTGLATDTRILEAMRDATCIQAAAWTALGIDPNTGGVITKSVAKSKKIGTAQIEYADTDAAAAARAAAYAGLVPAALLKLKQNDLIDGRVWSRRG